MTIAFNRRQLLGTMAALAASPALAINPLSFRAADGRAIPLRVWRARRRRGTILFSHGALSAPWKYRALIDPWVAAGWDVWAPLHVDSTDHPDTKRFPGLASWPARVADMRALADHVGARRYVAAGHSYGALLALTLGGASPSRSGGEPGPLRDRRVAAVVAFSPPGPGMGLIDAAGYATLAVPALIETGTLDVPSVPTGAPLPASEAWRAHLSAFEASARGGDRYAIVLDGADHYFGNLICRPERPVAPQGAQLDLAIARSLDFLRAYGLGDGSARRQLATTARTGPVTGPGLYRR